MPSFAATYTAWLTMKPMIRPASCPRSAATSAVGAAALAQAESAEAAPLDPSDWRSIRAEFALDPRFHHLAGFLLAPHPRLVRAAIARYRRALDANPSEYLHAHGGELE